MLAGSRAAADTSVTEQVGQALAPLVTRGWELRARPTTALALTRGEGPQRFSVEVLAERQPWLAAGAENVAEDPAELGRRLCHWYAALGTLPATATGPLLAFTMSRGRTPDAGGSGDGRRCWAWERL